MGIHENMCYLTHATISVDGVMCICRFISTDGKSKQAKKWKHIFKTMSLANAQIRFPAQFLSIEKTLFLLWQNSIRAIHFREIR